jgi:hypothetical protein
LLLMLGLGGGTTQHALQLGLVPALLARRRALG